MHLVTRNDISLPTDLWFPSSDIIKPIKSWQGTLGIETLLRDGEYLISLEAYYKNMKNIYDYKDSSIFSIGVPLESEVTIGKGEAYGMELFINKRIGAFTGWIGYTLSWIKHQFNELNNGNAFYPRYDRRHDISIVLTYKLSDSWELGATWVYGTGQAYTFPTGVYYFQSVGWDIETVGYKRTPVPYNRYSERNGLRLPPFHKLDLNFMYKYHWFDIPFELSINIYNAYNHLNPFSWYIGYSPDNHKYGIHQITLFPIIPTLGLSFKF